MLMSIVRRYVKDGSKSEEILHNAYIKIYSKLQDFKHIGSFDGWLKKITFHTVIDHLRQNADYREKVFLTDENYWFDLNQNDDINLDYNFYLKLIDLLPEAQRTVFNMYAIDGYKHREIAEILHIPEGTSKWHLAEARKFLQQKILDIKNYK